ncbi:MAG: GNAT family N-acetyltransferase [Actinomycetota bacterium]
MHPLDNAVWRALTGPQATVAEGTDLAFRYVPDVAPFAAVHDEPDEDAWAALATLVGPTGVALLFRASVPDPAGWSIEVRMPTLQMVPPPNPAPTHEPVERLGPDDVPAMLGLVARTRPGPFQARTAELGTYVGIREGDALVAMAGERMQLDGYTEISAVCTDPAFRGRGHAATLVHALVEDIRARGAQPFLHVLVENAPAIRLYERLGWTVRRRVEAASIRPPYTDE